MDDRLIKLVTLQNYPKTNTLLRNALFSKLVTALFSNNLKITIFQSRVKDRRISIDG